MNGGRNRQAGGFILAMSIVAGAVIGAILHQPSIGVLAGFALGAVLAVLVWLLNR